MDLIITGGLVVSQDDERSVRRIDVAINGNRIAALGERQDLERRLGPASRRVDATGCAVLPGLVNGHTHLFQAGMRGLGDGLPLDRWHAEVMVPAYEAITADDAYWFTLVAAIENVRSGVTALANVQAFPNDYEACALVSRAVGVIGLRAQLGKSLYGRGPAGRLALVAPAYARETERVFYELHGGHQGRVRFAVTPPRATRAPREAIVATHEIAKEYGAGVHTHVAETEADARAARDELGMSEIAYLDSIGVVDERFQAVHCVAISQADAALLADRGASAIHCPVSNMYLGSGVAELAMLTSSGVNVGLGTDGPASNNNQDMVATMKSAALLQRVAHRNAGLVPPGIALDMATRNGAQALGVDAGRIVPGLLADLVILDLRGVHHQPLHRPISSIIHAAHPDDVQTVIVDGRVILDDRRMVTVDEKEIVRRAGAAASALAARAGLDSRVAWPWI